MVVVDNGGGVNGSSLGRLPEEGDILVFDAELNRDVPVVGTVNTRGEDQQ